MEKHIMILLLTAFVVAVHSYPLGIIFETGLKSNATFNADGHAGAEAGWEGGPTIEGKAEGGVYARWLKNAYGKIGYIDSKGVPHGIVLSIGSNMDGKGVAEAKAKAGTNLVNTKVDKNANLGGGASYNAGFDIHFLDKSEVEGVEGVNKKTIKTSEETTLDSNQPSGDLNPVNRESKQVKDPKEDGIIKTVWNKIKNIGK